MRAKAFAHRTLEGRAIGADERDLLVVEPRPDSLRARLIQPTLDRVDADRRRTGTGQDVRSKFLGIVTWTTYWTGTALAFAKASGTGPAPLPGANGYG